MRVRGGRLGRGSARARARPAIRGAPGRGRATRSGRSTGGRRTPWPSGGRRRRCGPGDDHEAAARGGCTGVLEVQVGHEMHRVVSFTRRGRRGADRSGGCGEGRGPLSRRGPFDRDGRHRPRSVRARFVEPSATPGSWSGCASSTWCVLEGRSWHPAWKEGRLVAAHQARQAMKTGRRAPPKSAWRPSRGCGHWRGVLGLRRRRAL